MKRFSYDLENDIFQVNLGFAVDEKFKGNIVVGNVVLDLSTKDRVRGLELFDASVFLKDFGIDDLTKVKDVEMQASMRGDAVMLHLVLKCQNKEIPVRIAVALEQSLVH
ncbi:DUF2283 domain-containing protein [Candidatus Woesearchaeota archaeon]|nr:DUF2283 domain-containing protein [Candidatus Woesearchaeota archaeon]